MLAITGNSRVLEIEKKLRVVEVFNSYRGSVTSYDCTKIFTIRVFFGFICTYYHYDCVFILVFYYIF